MSAEAITDTIHEYMYEKMNESRDSEETKIKHVDRKRNYQKPDTNSERSIASDYRGAPNCNKQHDCPAKQSA